MLTLKDTSFLTIDKVPLKDANEMRMYLDAVHQDRVHTGKCPSSNSHQWQLREGATLPCGFFCCCCGFSPLATFPPDVSFRACCICADLSGSDPQFLLCAFLMMCLCHAERWAEMKQSGIVSVVCTLVFEKLVSLSHLDSLFLFFHFIFGCLKDRNFTSHWGKMANIRAIHKHVLMSMHSECCTVCWQEIWCVSSKTNFRIAPYTYKCWSVKWASNQTLCTFPVSWETLSGIWQLWRCAGQQDHTEGS